MSMALDYAPENEVDGARAPVIGRTGFFATLRKAFAAVRMLEPGPSPVMPFLSAPVDYALPEAPPEPLPYSQAQLDAAIKANENDKKMIWGDVPFIDFKDASARDLSVTRQAWTPVEHSLSLIDKMRYNYYI